MQKLIVLAILVLGFTSCEKEITIDLNSSDPQVVIEGAITDQPGPYFVKISKTVNFSDGNTYPPVSNALVIIADNSDNIDTLSESSPGIYQTSQIIGQPGNTYELTIVAEGKNYYANSTMPALVALDSLRFNPFSNPGSNANFVTVPVFSDPATFGNNYRFIQTINGELTKSYIVFNDNVNNGLVNERPIFSPDTDLELGDSINVEMRCIDLATYNYFYTLSQIDGGGPGGGTTPTNPPNNITGDEAIGIFSAYTVQNKKQEVK